MTLLQTNLDRFKRAGNCALILVLECHFLHLAAQFHEVSVGLNVRLLLLLVPIDPNLPRVLLCSDQLSLLVDFVEELLPLNVILLLQGLLLYL